MSYEQVNTTKRVFSKSFTTRTVCADNELVMTANRRGRDGDVLNADALASHLEGTKIVWETTVSYNEDTYKFMRSFISNPPLRAFLSVCDWLRSTQDTVTSQSESETQTQTQSNLKTAGPAASGCIIKFKCTPNCVCL